VYGSRTEAMQKMKNILNLLGAIIHKINVMRTAIAKRLCTPVLEISTRIASFML